MKSRRLASPQQWRRGQPLRERFEDNGGDSNSSTQYSGFSEYVSNGRRRNSRASTYLQMGLTNELRLENRIMVSL